MPPTLVMLASEQSGDGHSQCAKPFTSTQEAPNSQLISSQDLGADGSGGGREGGKGDKKRVPTLKQTDKQSQEAMLDPTPSPFPGTRQSSTSVPTCPPGPSHTFLAAGHAQLAAVGALVALHAGDSRLAGAQPRHLLAVVAHRAHRVAVTGWAGRGKKKKGYAGGLAAVSPPKKTRRRMRGEPRCRL